MENNTNCTEFKHSYELTFEEMYSVCRFYERKWIQYTEIRNGKEYKIYSHVKGVKYINDKDTFYLYPSTVIEVCDGKILPSLRADMEYELPKYFNDELIKKENTSMRIPNDILKPLLTKSLELIYSSKNRYTQLLGHC